MLFLAMLTIENIKNELTHGMSCVIIVHKDLNSSTESIETIQADAELYWIEKDSEGNETGSTAQWSEEDIGKKVGLVEENEDGSSYTLSVRFNGYEQSQISYILPSEEYFGAINFARKKDRIAN